MWNHVSVKDVRVRSISSGCQNSTTYPACYSLVQALVRGLSAVRYSGPSGTFSDFPHTNLLAETRDALLFSTILANRQSVMDIALLLNPVPESSSQSSSLPPPKTPKKRELTRDQRLQIKAFRSLKMIYRDIVVHLRTMGVICTERQIQYAENSRPTPQKQRCGPTPMLNTPTRRRIADFITSSKKTRRMPYIQVNLELQLHASESIIRRAMKKEGIFRRLARKKPPISEKNRLLRLAWAMEHVNWTRTQWNLILWTDETWVTDGRHTRSVERSLRFLALTDCFRTWISRRVGEENDPDCIVPAEKYKSGWMFWGCFSGGLGKGPHLFWEKDWGKINAETYSQKILPLIDGTKPNYS